MNKYLTKQMIGFKKMADNGQTIPAILLYQHSFDNLHFWMIFYKADKRLRHSFLYHFNDKNFGA